jgi:hypothetical protein
VWVGRSAVRLVSGASSRAKILDIDAEDPHALGALLAAPGALRPRRDATAGRPSNWHGHCSQAGDSSKGDPCLITTADVVAGDEDAIAALCR